MAKIPSPKSTDRLVRSCFVRFLCVLIAPLGWALLGCERAPEASAADAPPVVAVSQPLEREVTDSGEYTGRTAAVDAVEVRARVSGYLVEVHFREGSVVEKGDLLFEIDPRPFQTVLDEAKGRVAQWEARRVRAEIDASRNQRLAPQGAVSQRELDTAVADRDEARAAIRSAQAAVERAALDLEFTRVTAPIKGRTSRYLVTEGNLVTADATLLTTIVSIDPMYAYFDVDEATVLRVRQLIREGNMPVIRGGEVPVGLSLTPDDGFPHQGTIDFAENRVDPETGTLRLRGVFPNPAEALLPGLFVRVRAPIGKAHRALLVSDRAIDNDQGQKILYVVDDENTVVSRPVRVGALHDGLREIEDGVEPGERVIVNGLLQIRPGITVEPQLVDMPVSSSGDRE